MYIYKQFVLSLLLSVPFNIWAQQPAPLPKGIEISGNYYCNKTIDNSQTKKQSVIELVYNKTNGKITGSVKNLKSHFTYIMTSNNINRSKRGVFFWAPDKNNKAEFPILTEPMYLLKDGTLACATVHKIKGGTDYEVLDEDVHNILLFSKNQQKTINPDLENIANEIGNIATSAWGDFFGIPK